MKYPCMCGQNFETADSFSAHAVSCPKTQVAIREARSFADRYKAKIMTFNKNEASCMAGMALTQCRHLNMSVEELHQLVSIAVSNYEKEVNSIEL